MQSEMFRCFHDSSFISDRFSFFVFVLSSCAVFCLSPVYSCTWFNVDFHEKFVSPGIAHAKTTDQSYFNTVAVFIKLLFISVAFVLTTGLKVKWKKKKWNKRKTSSYKVRLLFFCFTWLSFRICLIFGTLDFFSRFFP